MTIQPTGTATATGTAHGLSWIGTCTDRPQQMSRFLADVLGIPVVERAAGYTMHAVADGSQIEVFTAAGREHRCLTTGPVPGVLVDDVPATAARLRAAGVELLGPTQEEHGHARQHFRAPDGHIWEVAHRPATTRPVTTRPGAAAEAQARTPAAIPARTASPTPPVPPPVAPPLTATPGEQARLQQHLRAYAAGIALLVVVNALTSPGLWWVVWPALGWGLGLLLHVNRTFAAGPHRGAAQSPATPPLPRR